MIFLVMTATAGGMPSATCLMRAPDCFATPGAPLPTTCFDVLDVAVDDGAARQRLDRIALEPQRSASGLGQFDHA